MGPDQTVEIMRRVLIEAMLLSAPLLVAAALVSLAVSLVQPLTSVQEQTLTAVPRLVVVFVITVAVLPWMVLAMFVVGMGIAVWLRSTRPAVYADLGHFTLTDPDSRNDMFITAPKKAAMPTSAPKIRPNPISTRPKSRGPAHVRRNISTPMRMSLALFQQRRTKAVER